MWGVIMDGWMDLQTTGLKSQRFGQQVAAAGAGPSHPITVKMKNGHIMEITCKLIKPDSTHD